MKIRPHILWIATVLSVPTISGCTSLQEYSFYNKWQDTAYSARNNYESSPRYVAYRKNYEAKYATYQEQRKQPKVYRVSHQAENTSSTAISSTIAAQQGPDLSVYDSKEYSAEQLEAYGLAKPVEGMGGTPEASAQVSGYDYSYAQNRSGGQKEYRERPVVENTSPATTFDNSRPVWESEAVTLNPLPNRSISESSALDEEDSIIRELNNIRNESEREGTEAFNNEQRLVAKLNKIQRNKGHNGKYASTSQLHVLEGLASYYADKFNGLPTASGEAFDMHAMTAAHKTLAFGTRVQVTNQENGAMVEVVINDRGPFRHDRMLDLSLGAATRLGMIESGVGRVKVNVIN